MQGKGFKAEVQDGMLVVHLGFSHPVEMRPPPGIQFSVLKNIITVEGPDKQVVGQMAAKVRGLKKPDPYKGKGIRYLGERVKIKPGKSAQTATLGE